MSMKQKIECSLKLLLLLGLMSCSHAELAKEINCVQVDWYELGRQDGMVGIAPSNLEKHNKNCEPSAESLSHKTLYENGRNLGLVSYCTSQMGFQVGKLGERYAGVCPKSLEQDFLKSYVTGRQIHILEKENDLIQARIKSLQNQLDQIQNNDLNEEILKLHRQFSQNETKIKNLGSQFN